MPLVSYILMQNSEIPSEPLERSSTSLNLIDGGRPVMDVEAELMLKPNLTVFY